MRVETARQLVAQAAEIAGCVPLYGERGTYEVREIRGVDERGAWITNCLTSSLMGYVRIPKGGAGPVHRPSAHDHRQR